MESGERRLLEELGLVCRLRPAGTFTYRAACPSSGLVEHELDHVLIGRTDSEPIPDASEVDATCWVRPCDIGSGVPEGAHAPWLAPALALAELGRAEAGW